MHALAGVRGSKVHQGGGGGVSAVGGLRGRMRLTCRMTVCPGRHELLIYLASLDGKVSSSIERMSTGRWACGAHIVTVATRSDRALQHIHSAESMVRLHLGVQMPADMPR